MNDEFYIGWQAKAAPGIHRNTRRIIVSLLLLAVVAPLLLAISQRMIGVSVFEWGQVKSFTGILKSRPYPHLLVARPNAGSNESAYSAYYLVKTFKHGLEPEVVARFDGQAVTLHGTLIYRGNQTMIEVADDGIKPATDSLAISVPQTIPLGRQTLVGEIVDSKCFLGVMNPGQLTPHRACAIRCISGGIPPVLLVRSKNGPAIYLLLVAADGKPVNPQVLDLVAEPVQITGEVERQGGLFILLADPSTYRRVTR
jgi:hypothetical protein